MHAIGIKRVFWTIASGEWEGAKVRDLIDTLEVNGSDDCCGGKGGGRSKDHNETKKTLGAFVTKHEVLMLRRVMGC
jgi:hypothetical protein